jgi:hypothetical protein
MARQIFEITAGVEGEGPGYNMFGGEHIVSIAPGGAATLGTGDYGIWTSESGPSSGDVAASVGAAGERRKKAA